MVIAECRLGKLSRDEWDIVIAECRETIAGRMGHCDCGAQGMSPKAEACRVE